MSDELGGIADVVERDRKRPPLLASRLVVAPLPAPVLARPRLLRQLDAGAAGPVTLVRAPAGWGKTTLLASWVRAAAEEPAPGGPEPVAGGPAPAWLSVESGDTGPRLWTYLAAALRTAAPGSTAEPVPPVPDDPPRPDQLELLAAALAGRERPVVLVLDDLHRITDPAALAGLEFLLRHTEQRLRLVVGARTELALPLHRWRLSGELTELGADDLACTDEEVADLLAAHGVALPAAEVPPLRERTGGWPAGLRFAALALRDSPDPARYAGQFGGDQPDVAGYLREEVLAVLPGEAADVLVRTAVVDTACGGLADALTGREDGERILAGLARDSGFLAPEGTRPAWYRCHPLLADLLHAELARLPADELRDLHRRAATWYAGNGRPAEALRHAFRGRHWERASELLVDRWPELIPYEEAGVGVAAPCVPPAELVDRDPELALAGAVERAGAGDPTAARGHLDAAVAAARLLPTPRRDRVRRLATAVELALARLDGDHPGVRAAAARLRGTVPVPTGPVDDPRSGAGDEADVRAVADTMEALSDLADGDLRRAAAGFDTALAAARRAGRVRAELVCASRSAVLAAAWGELRGAERTARDVLAGTPARAADAAHAHLALALVALHRDEPEEAEAHLAYAVGPVLDPAVAALAALCRAQLSRDRDAPADACRLLAGAREKLADRPAAGELVNWLFAAEAELRADRGDVATARGLLGSRLRDPAGPPEALAVAAARIELRAGDTRAAGYALPDWDAPAAAAWPLPVRLDAGLLDALLAERDGDARRARRQLERVLELAGSQGFRRVFRRAEPGIRDLLAGHLDAGTAHWPTVSDLVRGSAEPAERGDPEPGRTLPEPLTERELTILRYLQSILSNVEIASELSLSVNTVKTHVRNIYRKLDVTRRREAVDRARELRLI